MGLGAAYAELGGLRLPNRPVTEPSYTAPAAFTAEIGPVQPASGAWQLAHDWLPFADRVTSKKIALPSAAWFTGFTACGVSVCNWDRPGAIGSRSVQAAMAAAVSRAHAA